MALANEPSLLTDISNLPRTGSAVKEQIIGYDKASGLDVDRDVDLVCETSVRPAFSSAALNWLIAV